MLSRRGMMLGLTGAGLAGASVLAGCSKEFGQVIGIGKCRPLLEPVVVDDQSKIVQTELGGRHDGFPIRAFLHLAIPGDDIGVVFRAGQLGGLGHPHRDGEPVTERSGIGFDARHLVVVGMAVQPGVRLKERGDFLLRNEAAFGKRHV